MEKKQKSLGEGMPKSVELDMSASPNKYQRPTYRVVATTRDKNGTERLVTIGAAWSRVSKTGRKYLDLRLGYLKLFPVE